MSSGSDRAIGPALQAQRGFLSLVAAVAALRFLVPPGRIPGSVETWSTVGALWALGLLWIAARSPRGSRVGDRVGDVGAQNLGIQLLIVLPSVIVGIVRLTGGEGETSAAFPTNALVTVVVLPLACLVILTFAALPVLALLLRVRAVAAVIALAAVLPLACTAPAEAPVHADPIDPAAIEAGRAIYQTNGCAVCHGADGSGRGVIGAAAITARDYRDPSAYRVGTDVETLAQTIADGLPGAGGGMPGFAHLTLVQRTQLASFIASLQHPDSETVRVEGAWVGESLPGTSTTAAWMMILNSGDADGVVGAEVEGALVSIHHMTHGDGAMTMESLARLELPAGGTVTLASGGTHLMLEDLEQPLRAGEEVQVTLFLESKTAVRFSAPVRPREGAR